MAKDNTKKTSVKTKVTEFLSGKSSEKKDSPNEGKSESKPEELFPASAESNSPEESESTVNSSAAEPTQVETETIDVTSTSPEVKPDAELASDNIPESNNTPETTPPDAPARTEDVVAASSEGQSAPTGAVEPAAAGSNSEVDRLAHVGPRTAHSDEDKLEKFLRDKNNPLELTNNDLSNAGINMSKLGLLDGRVGKFKVRREFFTQSWKITIE